MYLFLLKKALPFTLTFVVGTALGGLTWLFGGSEKKSGETQLVTRTYDFKARCGSRLRHKLVAESKPLVILSKPDARWPLGAMLGMKEAGPAVARVTFGADGRVHDVEPLRLMLQEWDESPVEVKAVWEAVEQAARRIRFTPETVDGMPVRVTRDIEIRFVD